MQVEFLAGSRPSVNASSPPHSITTLRDGSQLQQRGLAGHTPITFANSGSNTITAS